MRIDFAKTINKIKGNKLFLRDAYLNTIAFVIYICSQQIFLLPIMAKLLDSDSYANLILYITIMNVFCNVLGGQLGVTHQLQKEMYRDNSEEEHRDFTLLMLGSSLLIVFGFPTILYVLRYDVISLFFITTTALISNFRLYIRYYFRIAGTYKYMIIQNIFYLGGIVIGLALYPMLKIMWLPLFAGELLGLVFSIWVIPVKILMPRKTRFLSSTLRRYSGLGASDALTNTVTLIDKLLIYPLMGAYPLAVYNAGEATSKVAALVVNPLNEVILVKLAKTKNKGYAQFIRTVIWVSMIAIVAIFIILIPIIYVFSYLLYKQYIEEICTIILLLSLSCAVGFTSSILKSFLLRYARPSQITMCYIVNICLVAVGGMVGAKYWGLMGFAGAVTLTRVELWASFVFVLHKRVKEEEMDEV